jgi:hypothetical protein
MTGRFAHNPVLLALAMDALVIVVLVLVGTGIAFEE